MKKGLILLVFALSFSVFQAYAQCAMCRRVAESSRDAHENKVGKGLNNGILYLMTLPYLLGGIGAFVWYKNRKKN
jgi:hypothetical protein